RNVKTIRVTDAKLLQASMDLLAEDVRVAGKVLGSEPAAGYVIDHTAENNFAVLRFRLNDVRMSAAEEPFKIGEQSFNAGSFLVAKEGNAADLRSRLEAGVTELGLTAQAVEKLPEVKSHPVGVPRVALVHTWTSTQNEGWFRVELDRLRIPYAYISDHV